MPFWKCYYHVVFATKHRAPIIEPTFEAVIFGEIRQKATRFGSTLYAVNGTEDHIHIATTIPPNVAVAKWIGEIKGASSRAVNTTFELDTKFQWQSGYGVLTFGELRLPFVVAYVNNQKSHHTTGKINNRLEQIED